MEALSWLTKQLSSTPTTPKQRAHKAPAPWDNSWPADWAGVPLSGCQAAARFDFPCIGTACAAQRLICGRGSACLPFRHKPTHEGRWGEYQRMCVPCAEHGGWLPSDEQNVVTSAAATVQQTPKSPAGWMDSDMADADMISALETVEAARPETSASGMVARSKSPTQTRRLSQPPPVAPIPLALSPLQPPAAAPPMIAAAPHQATFVCHALLLSAIVSCVYCCVYGGALLCATAGYCRLQNGNSVEYYCDLSNSRMLLCTV